ncbi:MAG TPA: beta-ketoacyl synthase N-terminal-like domain-containing protein [Dongiaceae bacterium]|nr:beta-ketoacyl synthase N-terminal-like domain-containing protein [Dongiaceae bacterium]
MPVNRSQPIAPTYVTAYSLVSALGVGNQQALESLRNHRGGLRHFDLGPGLGSTWFGHVDDQQTPKMADDYAIYDNNCIRLVQAALQQDGVPEAVASAKERYGAHRVGCFLGTITGGSDELERMYRNGSIYEKDSFHFVDRYHQSGSLISITLYVRRVLGITGPYATIGTACSSSAKVFAAAARAIQAGICDAAIVAGAEGLNDTLMHGFRSLGVLSTNPCRPWDKNRDGINLGAAAGVALLERAPTDPNNLRLVGYGETCDGYHMTAPHPEGLGIETCMRLALESAGLKAEAIDYINAHGSATPMNDASEDSAIQRVFGAGMTCSSTKGWTGHTQGASGITEALILLMGMQESLAPASLNTEQVDDGMGCRVLLRNEPMAIRYGLTNSMGFGGNNSTLIFGAAL